MLILWDLETGRLLRTFVGHEHGIHAVAMTPDGRYAISGSDDRTAKLWDLVSSHSPPVSVAHAGPVSARWQLT